MKQVFFIFTSIALIASCGRSAEEIRQQNLNELKADVLFLSSDSLEGRATGSAGEAKAAAYLVQRFTDLGLSPMGDSGTFQQFFEFVPKANPHVMETGDSLSLGMGAVKPVRGSNIIGFIDNKAEKTVIIGAHYDHLGMGDESSLFAGEPAIHNGADDNSSGVAALLELAQRLKKPGHFSGNNYLIIAFSGEEKGLWGSNWFCKNPTLPLENVNYMLNMDMVGRLKAERTLAINGVGTSPSWMPVLDSLQVDSINIVTTESGVGPSDHTSFYLKDIPVLHFFTGQHEDYHKPSDDADKINFEGMLSVINYIETLIAQLDAKGELEFTKTKDDSNENSPRFTVTLGVVPDYLYSGDGMRIDGVSEGKLAQRLGLQSGDIVRALGDSAVVDMMSYMRALSAYSSGDSSLLVIDRGGNELRFPVKFD
jgi:hypothetical protein